jgi:hypothetical protein
MTLAYDEILARQTTAFSFVLNGLARLAAGCETLDDSVRQHLQSVDLCDNANLLADFARYLRTPADEDRPLARISRLFHLEPIEALAVRLAIAAEEDLVVGHLLSHLQQPLLQSRPLIGLVAQAYAPAELHRAVQALGQGNAVRCGLLLLSSEDVPLPERTLRICLPTALALHEAESLWPGTAPITSGPYDVALGPSAEAHADGMAQRLLIPATVRPALVIRSGDAHEARAAASQIAAHMGLNALLVQTEQLVGMAPWLALNRLLPVFSQWLTPGERRSVPTIPGYHDSILVLTGPEGEFEADDRSVLDWRLETPSPEERALLWRSALGDRVRGDSASVESACIESASSSSSASIEAADAAIESLARGHRHAAGRIATLAARAKEDAAARAAIGGSPWVTPADIRAVSRRGDAVGLGSLAELIPDEVGDAALVVSPALREELESLIVRCRLREQFPDQLGLSIKARYRPSVRGLFVGPSGTGKTLAVAWLATRLGIPLFRVDLSAITSKYIGETEKNLSQLLARAEQSEVVLLFDEADALFGKRTDIQDSNDRFANAQTNYLLQRMESYTGITILTSNGRNRFDDAFSRRFDAIISFPLPGPEERRELWLAHLGEASVGGDLGVTVAQLNLLAAVAELTGGQIRNAVLRSAVAAAQEAASHHPPQEGLQQGATIAFRHLLAGIQTEYRKLSRQLPNELRLSESASNGAAMRGVPRQET